MATMPKTSFATKLKHAAGKNAVGIVAPPEHVAFDAKTPETRERRVQNVIDALQA